MWKVVGLKVENLLLQSEVGKGEGEEINSREQAISQNQKEKDDKQNTEEQDEDDKPLKSESESDDTSEEDTETTESQKVINIFFFLSMCITYNIASNLTPHKHFESITSYNQ